ncbi:MAG: NAD-dependent epimerase/dehydratase family protein [Gammaproteobacteria bacterium]|nr:NAD-dependent epimerase/dehydratase family protein [Gammaproteobacteria bacterium]
MQPSDNRRTTALVAGSTGLVGRECARLLAADPSIAEVRALVRRHCPKAEASPRVRDCLIDYEHLDPNSAAFRVDLVFCALGTTLRDAGSRESFRRVDFDYTLRVAEAARAAGARHLLLVSAAGADAGSRFFYNRVKGELEEAIVRLGYPSVTIARPSLLTGERSSMRVGEELGKRLAWLLPERWKPVSAAQVALALVQSARTDAPGVHILENPLLRAAR